MGGPAQRTQSTSTKGVKKRLNENIVFFALFLESFVVKTVSLKSE
jgi:hypothetical protein